MSQKNDILSGQRPGRNVNHAPVRRLIKKPWYFANHKVFALNKRQARLAYEAFKENKKDIKINSKNLMTESGQILLKPLLTILEIADVFTVWRDVSAWKIIPSIILFFVTLISTPVTMLTLSLSLMLLISSLLRVIFTGSKYALITGYLFLEDYFRDFVSHPDNSMRQDILKAVSIVKHSIKSHGVKKKHVSRVPKPTTKELGIIQARHRRIRRRYERDLERAEIAREKEEMERKKQKTISNLLFGIIDTAVEKVEKEEKKAMEEIKKQQEAEQWPVSVAEPMTDLNFDYGLQAVGNGSSIFDLILNSKSAIETSSLPYNVRFSYQKVITELLSKITYMLKIISDQPIEENEIVEEEKEELDVPDGGNRNNKKNNNNNNNKQQHNRKNDNKKKEKKNKNEKVAVVNNDNNVNKKDDKLDTFYKQGGLREWEDDPTNAPVNTFLTKKEQSKEKKPKVTYKPDELSLKQFFNFFSVEDVIKTKDSLNNFLKYMDKELLKFDYNPNDIDEDDKRKIAENDTGLFMKLDKTHNYFEIARQQNIELFTFENERPEVELKDDDDDEAYLFSADKKYRYAYDKVTKKYKTGKKDKNGKEIMIEHEYVEKRKLTHQQYYEEFGKEAYEAEMRLKRQPPNHKKDRLRHLPPHLDTWRGRIQSQAEFENALVKGKTIEEKASTKIMNAYSDPYEVDRVSFGKRREIVNGQIAMANKRNDIFKLTVSSLLKSQDKKWMDFIKNIKFSWNQGALPEPLNNIRKRKAPPASDEEEQKKDNNDDEKVEVLEENPTTKEVEQVVEEETQPQQQQPEQSEDESSSEDSDSEDEEEDEDAELRAAFNDIKDMSSGWKRKDRVNPYWKKWNIEHPNHIQHNINYIFNKKKVKFEDNWLNVPGK